MNQSFEMFLPATATQDESGILLPLGFLLSVTLQGKHFELARKEQVNGDVLLQWSA